MWGSKLIANYAVGRAGAAGAASSAAGSYAMSLGRGMNSLGASGRRTLAGAVAGGAYGAVSDDTSVIGGAMMGAGVGRYGGAALSRANRGGAGMGFGAHAKHALKGAGRGAWGQARADARSMYRAGRKLYSNGQGAVQSAIARAKGGSGSGGATLASNRAGFGGGAFSGGKGFAMGRDDMAGMTGTQVRRALDQGAAAAAPTQLNTVVGRPGRPTNASIPAGNLGGMSTTEIRRTLGI